MERELKLRLSNDDLDRLRSAPLLARSTVAPGASRLLTSTYFDTAALAFHACKASLRVCAAGDDRIQTLKLKGSPQAGLSGRDAFNMPVTRDTPDLELLQSQFSADSDCGKLIHDEAAAAQLRPVFVTRINRTVFVVAPSPGEEIEVALEEGVIEAALASTPFAALDLTLKQGEPSSLYRIALELLDVVPLRIERRSKADVGYGLIVAAHCEAVKAQPVQLGKRDSIEDAFCSILHNCLDQVCANERGVVSGHDPSCVHQMRVGLRRLRSALDLFANVIPVLAGLDDELRWIASELGAARDWEVLAGSTLERAGSQASPDEIQPVREACERIAVTNRQRAAAAVESVRYTRLALQLALWVRQRGWRAGMSDQQCEAIAAPVRPFAADILRRRHQKLLARGKGLAGLDNERRHRARIAAKKLRYATEFFASLCPKRAVLHYVGALTALQDDLGWRNDAVVADQLLRALPGTSPETASGAAFARGFLASRIAADRETLKKLWKCFRRLSSPH